MMKNSMQLRIVTLLLVLLLSGWSFAANANSQPIGKVILAIGQVTATNPDGEERRLKRRSKIYSGDILTTNSGSRCQIRFSDKSLVALTEKSLFKVDEYSFDPNRATKEKAIYSLLKGGMRSISGAIGKKNRNDYQLNTPVATIGIRGTAFNVGLIVQNGVQNLYGTVDSGAIILQNSRGDLKIMPGQVFHVPLNRAPKLILALPTAYPANEESPEEAPDEEESTEESSEQDSEESSTEGEESAEDNAEEAFTDDEAAEFSAIDDTSTAEEMASEGGLSDEPIFTTGATTTVEEPNPTTETNLVTAIGTLAPTGAAVGVSFIMNESHDGISGTTGMLFNISPNEFYIDTVDGIGNVAVAGTVYDKNTDTTDTDPCNPCTFVAATGTLTDTGGNSSLGVNWGRWSGSYIVTENGVTADTMGSFHYIYSPNATTPTQLQSLTGTASYTLAGGGGTNPTDQNGATGTLSSLSMGFDFSAQTLTEINMSLTTSATGTINVTSSTIAVPMSELIGSGELRLDGSNGITVTTGYRGHISGTFIGSGAEGLITSYGFKEDTSASTKAVSGTALLTPAD